MSIGGSWEALVLKLLTFKIIIRSLSTGIACPENIRPGTRTTPLFDPIEALSFLPFSNGRCLEFSLSRHSIAVLFVCRAVEVANMILGKQD